MDLFLKTAGFLVYRKLVLGFRDNFRTTGGALGLVMMFVKVLVEVRSLKRTSGIPGNLSHSLSTLGLSLGFFLGLSGVRLL